jgi:hypothetical protein
MSQLAEQIETYHRTQTNVTSPSILTQLVKRLNEVDESILVSDQSETKVVEQLLDRTEKVYWDLSQMDVPDEQTEAHCALVEAFFSYFQTFEELLDSLDQTEPSSVQPILADIDSLDRFVVSHLELYKEFQGIDAFL